MYKTTKKLDFRKIGLLKVKERISISNYQLSLLALIKLRIYVFYISLLELVLKTAKLATVVEVEDEEEE